MRLDLFVKEKYNISRQKAQALIKNGSVFVSGRALAKPSAEIDATADIMLYNAQSVLCYVSRGGYKLKKAIDCFNIDLENKYCIDVGASTGGFTDCMLKQGAERVLAVDVGTAQLSDDLRKDKRVVSIENTDIRKLDFQKYGNADFIGCDVSFISLEIIADSLFCCLSDSGEGVLLIKPQFEAGRKNLSKRGIVRDFKIHRQVIRDVAKKLELCGLFSDDVCVSPIKGGDGNTEYLLHISKKEARLTEAQINIAVESAKEQGK